MTLDRYGKMLGIGDEQAVDEIAAFLDAHGG